MIFKKNSSRKASREYSFGPSIWTWPQRKIRATFQRWSFERNLDTKSSGLRGLLRSITRFEGTEYRTVSASGEALVRSWPSPKLLANPVWWAKWLGQFGWRWITTRAYLPLLLALPAFATYAIVLGLISSGSQGGKGADGVVYKRLVQNALRRDDLATAAFGADALLRLYPASEEHLYNRALIHELAGEADDAKQLMMDLVEEHNSVKAAIWLADNIGNFEEYATWPKDQQADYLNWLSKAIEADPSVVQPRIKKSAILRASNNFQGAYAVLLPIAHTNVETQYQAAFLERELGLDEKAKSRADALLRSLKTTIDSSPQDTATRLRYASMLLFVQREQEAIELLETGLRVARKEDEPQIRSALVEAVVLYSSQILQTDKSPRGLMRALTLLRNAMAVDATHPALLEAVAQACIQVSESKNNEIVILREALVRGIGSDTAHFILGTIALDKGDLEEATQHLEIAAKNNPNLPGLLNNLAYTIMQQEEPDLKRALRLANASVRTLPNHPYLRETRGQIYFKLNKYTEAISDLEVALNASELRSRVRPVLAEAYEALGQEEIAKRQRELLSQGK